MMPSRHKLLKYLLLSLWFLASCSVDPTPKPSPPKTKTDVYFTAQGGGEPRSVGYWQVWNSCAPDNQAKTAAANGGRSAGWLIMDDLLQDPGILVGELQVVNCDDGLKLLAGRAIGGSNESDEASYKLAAQLITAQLNLAAGAEYCPAVDDAVRSAQLLLIGAGFDGSGVVLGPASSTQDRELARLLTQSLADYNIGLLCQ